MITEAPPGKNQARLRPLEPVPLEKQVKAAKRMIRIPIIKTALPAVSRGVSRSILMSMAGSFFAAGREPVNSKLFIGEVIMVWWFLSGSCEVNCFIVLCAMRNVKYVRTQSRITRYHLRSILPVERESQ